MLDDAEWSTSGLGPLMANDVEVLIFSRCLEVHRDCIELSVRGPGRASRQRCASLPQLALTEIVRNVDEVQFMSHNGRRRFLQPRLPLR